MRMLRPLARAPVLILLIMTSLTLSGYTNCGSTNTGPALSEKQLTKVAKASGSIAQYTGDVIVLVKTLYDTGVIKSKEAKDKIAQALKDFATGGKAFNDLVVSLIAQYRAGTLPSNFWSLVTQNFDQLSKDFVALVSSIPGLTGISDSKAFKIIVAAVVTLSQLLLNIGYISPAWKDIQRLIPNWREFDNSALFRREVLGELA